METDNQKTGYVVLTRAPEDNEHIEKLLKKEGFDTYQFPSIERQKLPLSKEHHSVLQHITEYDWVVFTSAYGAHTFFEAFDAENIGTASLSEIHIAVVGPETAKAVESHNAKVAFMPVEYTSASLAESLPDIHEKRIVLFRSEIAPDTFPSALKARGAEVTDIPIYTTKKPTQRDADFEKMLADGEVRAVVFASPSAVSGSLSRISDDKLRATFLGVPAVALGHTTEKALLEQDFATIVTAPVSSIYSIIDTLKTL